MVFSVGAAARQPTATDLRRVAAKRRPTSVAGSGAQYIITPFRGTRTGTPSDAITVQFGVDGAGAQVTGATLRMAA
jgi:hypothetical protein